LLALPLLPFTTAPAIPILPEALDGDSGHSATCLWLSFRPAPVASLVQPLLLVQLALLLL
jgi:hypothetical protein